MRMFYLIDWISTVSVGTLESRVTNTKRFIKVTLAIPLLVRVHNIGRCSNPVR